MTKIHRLSLTLAVVGLGLVLVGGTSVAWLFLGTRPNYSGLERIKGLTAKTEIYRDKYGVPHIFAANMEDAARALGYAHASERLFQMEMQRRAGQGRLAEAVGESMLDVDKLIRTLGLYTLATSSYAVLSPESQHLLNAYAEGVNAWIAAHPFSLPPEFVMLGITPQPWTPADSLVWGKLMALQLSKNYQLEALRAELAKKITPQQMKGLFPSLSDGPVTQQTANPATTPQHHTEQKPEDQDHALHSLGLVTGLGHAASNEWVIAGSRTDSGKPILANDPHLTLGAPILWYLARIVTPDLSLEGATVPGIPVVLLGQNQSIAWGLTTTGSDVQDLFAETVDSNDSTRYLTPKGSEPFITRTETIRVKGKTDVTLHVRATRHGPVLSDINTRLAALAGQGKVMALAFTGLGAEDPSIESLMRINRAATWSDVIAAFKTYQAPPQNFVFASGKGDIGYLNPGLVPIRKKGEGLVPADGASGAYDWTGMVPFDKLPRMYNPSSGVIFNANNALVAAGSKPYLGIDWEEPYRAERLQDLLNQPEPQTLNQSALMQADHISGAARQLLPHLLRQKPERLASIAALDLLRGWDGRMDRDRPEPLIFESWLRNMHQMIFVDPTGLDLTAKGPYAAASINYVLTHKGSGWCDGAGGCDAVILRALDETIAALTLRHGVDMKAWQWGKEHIALMPNKVLTHIPYLRDRADILLPSDGDFYTLDRGGSFDAPPEHPFARTHGGGYRGIYDLADPAQSRFMIATGQSGHALSPHYRDLAPLWNDVQSITLSGSASELAAKGWPKLTLKPAPQ